MFHLLLGHSGNANCTWARHRGEETWTAGHYDSSIAADRLHRGRKTSPLRGRCSIAARLAVSTRALIVTLAGAGGDSSARRASTSRTADRTDPNAGQQREGQRGEAARGPRAPRSASAANTSPNSGIVRRRRELSESRRPRPSRSAEGGQGQGARVEETASRPRPSAFELLTHYYQPACGPGKPNRQRGGAHVRVHQGFRLQL
ncbi:uncharacterized protein A4U43_C10F14050 [Asparagus officinalis]|uniref:Uncharacterized protein n=1 Tax=Asparagus officinalis TaxID=4686 RepID=A0A5P1E7A0_ASPOF|nr:uncharacterized protein A4U43_C10F14050 [Asparagus officinalis]